MQFATTALASFLAFTSSAAATPLQQRQESLQDWQVTAVSVGTPSGRPGCMKHPNKLHVIITLTYTHSIPLGNHQSQRHRPQHPQPRQRHRRETSYRALKLRHRTLHSIPEFIDATNTPIELRSQILHKRRIPLKPHMAVRQH
jgi:hypothetical protein